MRRQVAKTFLAAAVAAVAMRGASAAGWQLGTYTPPSRAVSAMAYDASQRRTVLFGGDAATNMPSNDTAFFDRTEWHPGPDAPPALLQRRGHAMAYDSARKVIVMFGGWGGPAGEAMNDTWELDGSTWRPGSVAPPGLFPRQGHGMAYDTLRGKAVLFGGSDSSGPFGDLWEYDGSTWTSPAAPPGPSARAGLAMAYDETRERTVVFGGSDLNMNLNDTWEWDGIAWQQGPAAPAALTPRVGSAMAYDGNRQALVMFGGAQYPTQFAETWIYDGLGWSPGPAAPPGLVGRNGAAMAWDSDKARVRLFGGYPGSLVNADDTWELGPSGWAPNPDTPIARQGHVFAYDEARSVGVLFGGFSARDELNDTWELEGSLWRHGPPAPAALTPRMAMGIAFDSRRGRMVIFGGGIIGSPFLAETWEYDGAAWTQGPAAPAGMEARWDTAMAFDSGRGVTVLFSGQCSSRNGCADTWEYDGTAWKAGPPASPGLTGRYLHSMEYDPARRVVVMTGGYDSLSYQPLSDVWEYDGSSWRQVSAMLPPPRLAHSISLDRARGKMVVIGGTDAESNGTVFDDVEEFDGSAWQSGVSMPLAMRGRYGHRSYYDARRGRIVLFGGADASYALRSDVWEYGTVRDDIVAGGGFGPTIPNRVRVLDEAGLPTAVDFLAYGAGAWGVAARGAQIMPAGVAEIVTGPGPGPTLGPQVRGFLNDGTPLGKVNFFAYGTLRYGAAATGAAVDADAWDEIVTGAGPGAVFGPQVRGWDVDGIAVTSKPGVSYFAYSTLRYGVRVAGGDIDGDRYGEVLTGPGAGAMFGPHVRGWNVDGGPASAIAKVSFYAFGGGAYGAEVECGDVDRDGFAEIAVAPGPDPAAPAQFVGFGYDGISVAALPGFTLGPWTTLYGGRVGAGDLALSDAAEILAAPGPDPSANALIESYAYDGASLSPVLPPLAPFASGTYGCNVAGATLGM